MAASNSLIIASRSTSSVTAIASREPGQRRVRRADPHPPPNPADLASLPTPRGVLRTRAIVSSQTQPRRSAGHLSSHHAPCRPATRGLGSDPGGVALDRTAHRGPRRTADQARRTRAVLPARHHGHRAVRNPQPRGQHAAHSQPDTYPPSSPPPTTKPRS